MGAVAPMMIFVIRNVFEWCTCMRFIRRKTQISLPTRFGIERRSTLSSGRRNIPDYQIVYEMIRGKRFISRFAPG